MIFQACRTRSVLAKARAYRGAALSASERAAVLDVMAALPRPGVGRRLKPAYTWIVWTFARQRIDAAVGRLLVVGRPQRGLFSHAPQRLIMTRSALFGR